MEILWRRVIGVMIFLLLLVVAIWALVDPDSVGDAWDSIKDVIEDIAGNQ